MKETDDAREARKTNGETRASEVKNETLLKKAGIVGVVALAAFLLGFVPMWISARTQENERAAAIKTLRLSVLQNTVGTAALNARRGEFEQARQQASDFYTDFRTEMERETSAFDAQQRSAAQPILAQRDETITLLARNDTAAVDRLTDLYFAFMQMKNSPDPAKK
ncbi:MAG: hypothetical protein ABIO91_06975 [Pyrinomonadaceae bacterium]